MITSENAAPSDNGLTLSDREEGDSWNSIEKHQRFPNNSEKCRYNSSL